MTTMAGITLLVPAADIAAFTRYQKDNHALSVRSRQMNSRRQSENRSHQPLVFLVGKGNSNMRMPLRGLIVCCLLLMAKLAISAAEPQIKLLVDGSETIKLSKNTQIMVGDESKLAARLVTPTQLLLKGLAPGYTDVWLINDTPKRLRVTIERPVDERLKLELTALQQMEPNLEISRQSNFVIARGQVSMSGTETLNALATQYHQLLLQTEVTAVDPPMPRLSVKNLKSSVNSYRSWVLRQSANEATNRCYGD